MKKITRILSFSAIIGGIISPIALIIYSNNQEQNSVISNELNQIEKPLESNDKATETFFNSNDANCFGEDSKITCNEWIGITSGAIVFLTTKEYVDKTNWGEVKITGSTSATFTVDNFNIPDYVTYNSKQYYITEISTTAFVNNLNNVQGTISIPSKMVSIGDGAFMGSGFDALDLSRAASLTKIGHMSFSGCKFTGDLVIPSAITFIGEGAFESTSYESIDFSQAKNYSVIERTTFHYCFNLKSIKIPSNIKSINDYAFEYCTALTSVDLSDATSLQTIGAYIFEGCKGLSDASIEIPNSVTHIGNYAFATAKLKKVTFLSKTPPVSLGTGIFAANYNLQSDQTIIIVPKNAKPIYDPLAINEFGLKSAAQIEEMPTPPESVQIKNLLPKYDAILQKTNWVIASPIADVLPIDTTNKKVIWSIENKPSWIDFSATGEISVNSQGPQAIGDHKIKVTAMCEENNDIKSTVEVTISVVYAPIDSFLVEVTTPSPITFGADPIASLAISKAKILPSNAEQNVTWSILNKPDWMEISSTGVISTNKKVIDKNLFPTQKYTIQAETLDSSKQKATAEFIVNFLKPDPQTISINNLEAAYFVKAKDVFIANPIASIDPVYANEQVQWLITGNKPNGMTIDENTGKITYAANDDNVNDIFVFNVNAKSNTSATMGTKQVSITIINADPTGITITSPTKVEYAIELSDQPQDIITQCSATIQPIEAKQEFTWSLVNAPSWLKIDPTNGKVFAIANTNIGDVNDYNFKIKVETIAIPKQSATLDIKLSVVQPKPTNIKMLGLNTIEGYKTKADSTLEINNLSSQVFPAYADPNVKWSLTQKPEGMEINADSGLITYTPTKKSEGPQLFKVKCESKLADTIFEELESSVIVDYADVGEVKITDIGAFDLKLGENTDALVTCSATIEPASADQRVTWSILNKPDWIEISSTGVISINNAIDTALVNGPQTITVKATSVQDGNYTGTKNLVINFAKPAPTEVTIDAKSQYQVQANKILNEKINSSFQPIYANDQFDWRLENAPKGMTINNIGELEYAPITLLENTPFKIILKSLVDNKEWSFDSSVIVTYADVSSVSINNLEKTEFNLVLGNDATKPLIEKCEASVNPNGLTDPKVKWSLSANHPSWVKIDKDSGKLTIESVTDPKFLGEHLFFIIATSEQDSTKTDQVQIKINFSRPIATSIKIDKLLDSYDLYLNEQNKSIASPQTNLTPEYAIDEVSWELKTTVNWIKIDPITGVIFTTEIGPDAIGNFIVEVVVKSKSPSTATDSKVITINVLKKQEPEVFPIWAIAVSAVGGAIIVIGVATGTGVAIHKKRIKK